MTRGTLALGYLQYFVVPAALGNAQFNSGQDIPPIISPLKLVAGSVGNKPTDALPVSRMQGDHLVKKPFDPLRLGAAQVTLAAFHAHNLARASYLEPGGSTFMSFKLWHLVVSLPLLRQNPSVRPRPVYS